MMDIFTGLVASLIYSAAYELLSKLRDRQPLSESKKFDQIERIDRRMSPGIAKRDGKYVMALLVEKAESWVIEKAKEYQNQNPQTVIVEVTGKAYSSIPIGKIKSSPQAKLVPGISIGHFRGSAGTLGGFVRISSKKEMWTGIIGSSHVLSMINSGQKGEDIIQPGWPDGPRVFDNRIGTLENYTYLVHYQQKGDALNTEDIAVIRPLAEDRLPISNLVTNPKDQKKKINLKGCLPSKELFKQLGESVYKVGRSSGFTEGILDVTNVPQYSVQLPNGRLYIFSDVAAVKNISRRPFSEPGDSGSIVYTSEGKAIGTVLGASSTHSFVVPLSTSLEAVKAELL